MINMFSVLSQQCKLKHKEIIVFVLLFVALYVAIYMALWIACHRIESVVNPTQSHVILGEGCLGQARQG